MAYFLEKTSEDGPFVRARVIVERNGMSYAEIFEIGEPVHLSAVQRDGADENKIWWIRGFNHLHGQARVFVSNVRSGHPGELGISVRELVKVPAMLRLAVESQ